MAGHLGDGAAEPLGEGEQPFAFGVVLVEQAPPDGGVLDEVAQSLLLGLAVGDRVAHPDLDARGVDGLGVHRLVGVALGVDDRLVLLGLLGFGHLDGLEVAFGQVEAVGGADEHRAAFGGGAHEGVDVPVADHALLVDAFEAVAGAAHGGYGRLDGEQAVELLARAGEALHDGAGVELLEPSSEERAGQHLHGRGLGRQLHALRRPLGLLVAEAADLLEDEVERARREVLEPRALGIAPYHVVVDDGRAVQQRRGELRHLRFPLRHEALLAHDQQRQVVPVQQDARERRRRLARALLHAHVHPVMALQSGYHVLLVLAQGYGQNALVRPLRGLFQGYRHVVDETGGVVLRHRARLGLGGAGVVGGDSRLGHPPFEAARTQQQGTGRGRRHPHVVRFRHERTEPARQVPPRHPLAYLNIHASMLSRRRDGDERLP